MSARTILIADDEVADIAALRRVFKSAKLLNPVRIVNDGAQTIAYLEGNDPFTNRAENPYPAVLFLDLKMPRVSGMDVLRRIQNRPQHKNLKVIVFTSIGNVEEIRQTYQLGANSFLAKPVSLDDFRNLIRCLNGLELLQVSGGFVLDSTSHQEIVGDHASNQKDSRQEHT